MMKKNTTFSLVFAIALLLSGAGCGYFSQYDNVEHSKNLRVGMSKDEVRNIMGEPLQETYSADDLWFYYTETRWHDCQNTRDECMPLVFEEDKLIGWGNNFFNKRRLQKEEYERPTIEGLR